jgi:hypothetical protein
VLITRFQKQAVSKEDEEPLVAEVLRNKLNSGRLKA